MLWQRGNAQTVSDADKFGIVSKFKAFPLWRSLPTVNEVQRIVLSLSNLSYRFYLLDRFVKSILCVCVCAIKPLMTPVCVTKEAAAAATAKADDDVQLFPIPNSVSFPFFAIGVGGENQCQF